MAKPTSSRAAASNVTRLPTAAPRKVENSRFAEQRRISFAARQASPFRATFKHHQQREAEKTADVLAEVERTPALHLVMALLASLETAQRAAVVQKLAFQTFTTPEDGARQALALATTTMLNYGQQLDLLRAMKRES